MSADPLRVLLALPGAHRVARGAEAAFEALAEELARGGDDVTLVGGGPARPDRTYRYVSLPHRPRERFERFPTFPPVRTDIHWEQLAFARRLRRAHQPSSYDVSLACDFPFVHWVLRGRRRSTAGPAAHVFVTQNGDWPAHDDRSEFRFFDCDGLVCTNPGYHVRNRERYRSALIPNGVDADRFAPGPGDRSRYGLPAEAPVVLMAAALVPYKRVADGIEVVARLPDVHLVVAGDGPQRAEIDALGASSLPGRFRRLQVASDEMPALYRSVDALLHLAVDEPFGNVYIEALASGLPVVALDTANTRWILGDDGTLVADDTIDAHARGVAAALADPGAGAAGRSERARARFDWPVVAASYRAFLREVVAARAGRR